jgi:predicted nucleic acid-binding Zn ribbon protein
VGPDIAAHTKKLELKNGRLFIHLDSSVARSELHYAKSAIIEKVNAHFTNPVVETIILL